ncbi:MAG: tetratricopeptide repeat protein [Alphaproteobacteria bacterium]|nr:tetratricopeptide repeat protein [Alphaproteobacteria bacterium]
MSGRVDPLAEGDRLAKSGDSAGAMAAYEAAFDGAPITARARAAELLLEIGRAQGALTHAEDAWRIAPNAPEALLLMGRVAWRVGAVKEALRCLDRIGEGSEFWPAAQAERAGALLADNRPDVAYEHVRDALKQHAGEPTLWLAMGHTLMGLDRLEDAEAAYRKTTDLLPGSGRALAGVAEVCLRLGRPQEAVEAGEQAVEASGNDPVARTVLAHALLAVGRHEEGWAAYEARFQAFTLDRRVGARPRSFEFPSWNGSDLSDSSILVWGEGAATDEIYFSALLPQLVAQAPHPLILECDPRLEGLFARSFPVASVIARANPPAEEITDRFFHWQTAIGGLALRLKAYEGDYGAMTNGYLAADAGQIERWRGRWTESGASRVIGLAWRHPDTEAARRSVPLAPLLNGLAKPGRAVVSLQRGMTDEERATAGERMRIEPDWDTNDVDDLAARTAACDVVVSIDSLVAHLAAGLGLDTRILLDTGADGRWGIGRIRTPWYPSASLYWQGRNGAWDKAIAALTQAVDGG